MKRPEKVKARPPAKAAARRVAVLAVARDERAWAARVVAERLARPATAAAVEERARPATQAAAGLVSRAILVVPEELAAAA